jgi:hypothetical protein
MRRALAVVPIVFVMAAVVAPVVAADPGGGGRGARAAPRREAIDLSTRAAINRYLSTIGVDRSDVVFQQGRRNYAGPNCPGKGWTCTEGTGAVVQTSRGSGSGSGNNIFVCHPASTGTNPGFNTCVIVQVSTTGTNRATCIEHDEQAEGSVSQSCSITQTSTSGRNFATVVQSIKMETSDHGTAEIAQTQEGHQDAGVAQTSTTGSNTSLLSQTIHQEAKAVSALTITQSQNAANAGPNSDAEVSQTSDQGKNLSTVLQVNVLHAKARGALEATQSQGSNSGGLEGTVHQVSDKPSQSFNRQVERQTLDAADIDLLIQTQIDPKRCCSHQVDNPKNVWDIDQIAVQQAGDHAFQEASAFGDCETTGKCTVDQTHIQNGEADTNSCSGNSCHIAVTCFRGGESGGEQFCVEPSPSD